MMASRVFFRACPIQGPGSTPALTIWPPVAAGRMRPAAAAGPPVDIAVPAAGESITSANVAEWRKKDGEHVEKGEILVTLDTDKVSNELEAEADGVLTIIVAEGEEVAIGTVIGKLEETAGSSSDAPAEAAAPAAVVPAPVQDAPAESGEPVEIKVPAAGESITSANVAAAIAGAGSKRKKPRR